MEKMVSVAWPYAHFLRETSPAASFPRHVPVWQAIWHIRQPGKEDRIGLVPHIRLEHEFVPSVGVLAKLEQVEKLGLYVIAG